MKISMQIGYSGGFAESIAQVQALEKAGMDIVYVAEAYGYDAVSLMGYMAAVTETVQIASGILPIYTRTPTLIAMTAAGVDDLSEGRCILGLGASGPQVIEGFHGVPYDAPIQRTREIIEICRARCGDASPSCTTASATSCRCPRMREPGWASPSRSSPTPAAPTSRSTWRRWGRRTSSSPQSWQTAGCRSSSIPSVPPTSGVRTSRCRCSEASCRPAARWTPSPGGSLAIGPEDEVAGYRDFARAMVALYVGGMGARGRNFYNTLFSRYGYEAEAKEIQDLYLDGKKAEAAAAVPASFLAETSLCGDEGYVKERIAEYKADAGVTVLNVTPIAGDLAGQAALIEKVKELSD